MTTDDLPRTDGDDRDDDPEAVLYSTVPLEAEDGSPYVIAQQNVGVDNELGGGEWPDPDTPARSPAPGSVNGTRGRSSPDRPRAAAASAATDHEVDDDDLPGASRGPRPRLGDFGASEPEQRRAVGRPER